jgi:hypothetical protein
MFDSASAFNRYRLEVIRNWPASEAKDKLVAAIESSLQKSGRLSRLHQIDRVGGAFLIAPHPCARMWVANSLMAF